MGQRIGVICSVIAAFCLSTTSASAIQIDYVGPDEGLDGPGGMTGWMGDDVWYAMVSESNDAGVSRFGAPSSVTGNAIDFDPQNFEASTNGNASEIVDSQLNFMVIALPDQVIDSLQFTESGDTTLFAFAPDQAFTSVSASIFIDVIEVDGVALNSIVNLTGTLVFTPSNGDYQVGVDGSPAVSELWTGSLLVDIEQGLIDNNIDFQFGATKVNVALDNTLTAGSTGSASAFIRKKDADGLTVTSNIPEPSSGILMGLIGSLAVIRGRRAG